MKPISILALVGLAAAADYPAFIVPHLATNQPNGDKFGYYWIDFNVTSENGDALSWCFAWWGDNPDQTPVDKWIPCTTEYNGQNYSDTSFKLTQKLQIGDFKFALKQNFTETIDGTTTQTITTTNPYHISNATAGFPYNCTINPFMNPYNIHASGNCETTAPLTIPITDASPACEFAKTVSLSFPIEVRTEWGDNVYIVGSIPELGNWDLSRAVPLNADHYTSSKMIWTGGDVKVKAGTTFEWKAVQKNRDGSWMWECGENWVASVDEYTCGEQVVGNDPTWMRCGNH